MTNIWENRERRTKRIALIVSLLLHLVVIFAVTSSTGENSIKQFIEQVFSAAPSTDNAQS